MSSADSRVLLIIHPGALGDVLLALPAMQVIRSQYRSHWIILVAGSEVGRLLQRCQIIDRHIPLESGDVAGLFAGDSAVPSSLRPTLERCDGVVGWFNDRDGSLCAALKRAGVPRISVGSPTSGPGIHQSERFMGVVNWLRAVCISGGGLSLPASLKQAGADRLRITGCEDYRRLVLCHPGSGSSSKCVRADVMAEVIRRLREMDLKPVIIGGPADDQIVQRVVEQGLPDVPVIQHQPLDVLAGVLAHARLFVGHDSGVTHLAAALHVPTVALFGPTDPVQWAPRGPHVFVVRGNLCTCRGSEQIRHCLERPCLPHSPEAIADVAVSALTRYQSVTKS